MLRQDRCPKHSTEFEVLKCCNRLLPALAWSWRLLWVSQHLGQSSSKCSCRLRGSNSTPLSAPRTRAGVQPMQLMQSVIGPALPYSHAHRSQDVLPTPTQLLVQCWAVKALPAAPHLWAGRGSVVCQRQSNGVGNHAQPQLCPVYQLQHLDVCCCHIVTPHARQCSRQFRTQCAKLTATPHKTPAPQRRQHGQPEQLAACHVCVVLHAGACSVGALSELDYCLNPTDTPHLVEHAV